MAVTAKRLAAVLQATPKEIIPRVRSGSRELYGAEREAVIREHCRWFDEKDQEAWVADITDAPIAKFAALTRTQRQAIVTEKLREIAKRPSSQWKCSENQLRTLKQNRDKWKSCTFETPCGLCNRCRGQSAHRGNGYRPRQGPTRSRT
jgi:hypothetical protein